MTLPLRARLAAVYVLLVAALLATLNVVSYRVFARQLEADATKHVTELTDGLHGYLRFGDHNATLSFDGTDADQAAFVGEAAHYYQVYDVPTGALLARSAGMEPLGLRFTPAEARGFDEDAQPFDITTIYGRYRVANSIIADAPGGPKLLQVGVPLATVDAALGRYLDLVWWCLPVSLIVVALSAWWTAGLALAPLSRVAAATRSIDVNGLSRRLPVRGARDEIDEVAIAFNGTLTRLERAVAEMRQFSAALAHELRTPLAALRGETELGLRAGRDERGAIASQLEEIDRLNRLIDQVLTLARAESGQIPLTFTPVDLVEVGSAIVEQLEPIAQARGVELRSEPSRPAIVEGDAGWLQRLMLNLLDNAIKFTAPGGHVTLRVTRVVHGVRLDVDDTGIGIAPDALRRVFDPFFRGDESRSSARAGAGLGLSLVKWIVDAHRGRVAVQSQPGEGSTFTVSLPASQSGGGPKR